MSGLARTKKPASASEPHPLRNLGGIVHILTCGSVDDGKSTLIGRLLWDATELPHDERARVRKAAQASGNPERLDYSLLLDGLVAEREQGITIDVAWRYLDTERRRVVLIDSPGHDQYTRNMASGASHADAAIMLIDARHGLKRQTRRHAAILHLMGVPRVILAVNKMDLVGWSEERYREIEHDFLAAVAGLGFIEARAVPVSARHGDNVAAVSQHAHWYEGETLVELLEGIPSRKSSRAGPFRMPVQTVLRDGQDFRGLAGTISSGAVRVGDEVIDTVTGRKARVARIASIDGDLAEAGKGKAVTLVLDTDLDVARGAVLADPDAPAVKAARIKSRIVWLSERPFEAGRSYLLRTATDLVPVSGIEIRAHLDLDTLALAPASGCSVNDIAAAAITLGRPAALDPFGEHQDTGGFLLVDALTGATLAAGIVAAAISPEEARSQAHARFRLTPGVLAGLCSDLGSSEADQAEYRRRAREVLHVLSAAGVAADFEDQDPISAD